MSEPALTKKMSRLFNLAIDEFKLVSDGDRILIGLSGGKDSLSLVNFLSIRRDTGPQKFEIVASHIKFSNLPYEVDLPYMQKFCEDRKVELKIVDDQIRDAHMGNDTCLHCSRFRRAKLMELARVYNCNKLALGHHLDDVVATLLMNMSQHGRFAGMAVKLDITVGEMKYPLTLIRPLCMIAEDDIRAFIAENDYKPEKCRCPWGDQGFRSKTRVAVDILCKADERVRMNLFRSQFNIHQKFLGSEQTFDDVEDIEELGESKGGCTGACSEK